MRILVGSENPVKIESVREAFSRYFGDFELISMTVDSGVPEQPIDDDTFRGAERRAEELKRINEEEGIGAEIFVGIEGGIKKIYSRWFSFGVACVMDRDGRKGFGTSPLFEIPDDVKDSLLSGTELGKVMDSITGQDNTKRHDGAIGFFTKGRMNRKELYSHGLVVALIPILNQEMFFGRGYF